MTPRYVVCEITGQGIPAGRWGTTVWIADSLYGYREVAWYRPARCANISRRRARAARRCAELNAEDAAWMRDNGYAASVSA